MPAIKKISPEAVAVLASMEVDRNLATFTCGQLDRALYVEVNKALEALGGKWSRGKGGHLFEGDPRDAIDSVVLAGAFTDAKQLFQFFETPEALAEELVASADVRDGMRVLEPSAGRGRIVKAIRDATSRCTVFACELQKENFPSLNYVGGCDNIRIGDFMEARYADIDRVVMNPPFTRQQDVDHVTRAFSMLKPGGRLVSVVSGSATTRQNKKGLAFKALVEAHGSYNKLPPDTFKESGTGVQAGVVVLDKP